MTLTKIRKRDGRLAEFNEEKIARAIEKAFNATYKPGRCMETLSVTSGRRPESWPTRCSPSWRWRGRPSPMWSTFRIWWSGCSWTTAMCRPPSPTSSTGRSAAAPGR